MWNDRLSTMTVTENKINEIDGACEINPKYLLMISTTTSVRNNMYALFRIREAFRKFKIAHRRLLNMMNGSVLMCF